MKSWSFGSRLLLALALFGLVLGPMAAASAAPVFAAQTTAAMPDGMPCCPDDQPAVPDCAKDCPVAVLCVSFISVSVSETPALIVRHLIEDQFQNGPDTLPTSLVGEPPPRPPKA